MDLAEIDGGLASSKAVTLSLAQSVSITSSGDDSGGFFWISGKAANDSDQTVKIAGANKGVVTTTEKFKSISSISFKATGKMEQLQKPVLIKSRSAPVGI